MAQWYSIFAHTYDGMLERLYRPFRAQAFERVASDDVEVVLDVACGTGQNFPFLQEILPQDGLLVGIDASSGMLARAAARRDALGDLDLRLENTDAREAGPTWWAEVGGGRPLDLAVCALGMSVLPEWEAVFASTYACLRPGGQYLIFDAHADKRNLQTPIVELMARADLSRQVWAPLEAASEDFSLDWLEDASPWTFGGRLLVAHGRRPR